MVSDDPLPNVEVAMWVADLDALLNEEGELTRVFSANVTGTRDATSEPAWALDSSRFAFSNFQQADRIVRIMETRLPEVPEKVEGEASSDHKATVSRRDRCINSCTMVDRRRRTRFNRSTCRITDGWCSSRNFRGIGICMCWIH